MGNYEILHRPAKKIIGIEMKTVNDPGRAAEEIPLFWEKFYEDNICEKIPNVISHEIYGLYTNYEGDHTKPYSLIIGCEVSSLKHIPKGLVGKAIPPTTFAKFTAKGEFPESLLSTWEKIWLTDFDRAFTFDYEVYGDRFQNPESPEVDVYIALNPEKK